MRQRTIIAAIAIGVAGCANLNTVNRSTELPGKGATVHLDAAQRVVIGNSKGWACAEPSPDALQGYASSLGLGFAAPSKESVSLAQQMAASAGSFGLRTQSITLMRDALYRVCELYFNKAISKQEATQLLQRSQDLALGILAIEQLTGAVVAQQVVLKSNSAATAAAAINDTQKELDRSRADEDAKKTASETAKKALEAQEKVVAEKTKAAAAAKASAGALLAAIDDIAPRLEKANAELETAKKARTAAQVTMRGLEAAIKGLTAEEDAGKKAAAVRAAEASKIGAKLKEATDAKDQAEIDKLTSLHQQAVAAEKAATAELTAVQGQLAQKKKELGDEDAKEKARAKEAAAAQRQVNEYEAAIAAAKADPLYEAHQKAAAELKAATEEQTKKQAAAAQAGKVHQEAQANTKKIEALGSAATTAGTATGAGTADFSTATNRHGVDKDTAQALANATENIVKAVLYKGHLTDTCGTLLTRYARDAETFGRIRSVCDEVIAAAIKVHLRQAVPGTLGPTTPLGKRHEFDLTPSRQDPPGRQGIPIPLPPLPRDR